MASREVLKEFLVSLGFKIDEASYRKFTGALGNVTRIAAKTGAAVAAAAVSVEAYVQIFASSMEKIYYTSRRTQASVANIQALEFGAKKIGIAGEDARASLEAMAATLRLNPGMRAMLNNLVGYRSEGVDNVRVMTDLVAKLAKLPHFVGARMAGMFGMDESTFLMMKQELPKLMAEQEKFHKMQKRAGVDSDTAAAASVEYMNALRDLWAQIVILSQALAIALLPKLRELLGWLNPVVERFTKWVNVNREFISQRLDDFFRGFVGWLNKIDFEKVFDNLDKTVKKVDEIVQALGGWKTVGIALAALSFAPLINSLVQLGIAITTFMGLPAVIGLSALLAGLAAAKYFNSGRDTSDRDSELGGPPRKDRKRGTVGMAGDGESVAGMLVTDVYKRISELMGETWNSPDQSRTASNRRNEELQRLYRAVLPEGGTIRGALPGAGPSASASTVINQNTTINAAGGNSAEVSRNVLQGQRGVNADLASMVRYSNKAT